MTDVPRSVLGVLVVLVALAGGFVGLLYGGGVTLGTKTVTLYRTVTVTAPTQTTGGLVIIRYYGFVHASEFAGYKAMSGYIANLAEEMKLERLTVRTSASIMPLQVGSSLLRSLPVYVQASI